jgi:3-phosphoglycerate kinase
MEAIVSHSPLNETQIFLLQAFTRIKSEEEKADIQAMLLDYYRKRVDFYANDIFLSNEKIEDILNSHYRTPYK